MDKLIFYSMMSNNPLPFYVPQRKWLIPTVVSMLCAKAFF
jgi:hypothetical protein